MPENILETRSISYSYPDGTKALDQVSIRIKKGSKVAVLGSNGAGKSTLFLNLNGVLKPTGGRVFFDGREVDYKRSSLTELRKNVGIVFQDPDVQLFSSSVYQEVSFGPMNLKLPEHIVRERVESSLEALGISHLKERPTHFLSYGQ
jgi:cobalt/nickel transport system ATP-binding protein